MNGDFERVWDEYDWEHFLRQQDRKTEQYMELFEKFMHEPDRDRLIAEEMGWEFMEEESEAFELGFHEDWEEPEFDEEMEAEEDDFERHPLYQASLSLAVWIDQFLDELDEADQNHPAAVRLATQSAVAGAKLAAALCDQDSDEIGMIIAHLKRALKATSEALDASVQLQKEFSLMAKNYATLRQRLFQVRDGIILLIGEYRKEWRRRFENP